MSKSKKNTNAIITRFFELNDCEAVKAHFVANYPAIPEGDELANFYSAYESAYRRTASKHATVGGKTYSGKSPLTAKEFATLVAATDCLDGVQMSMAGQMLYVKGNTKSVKDRLKAMGYWYSGQQKCWYFKTVNADFAKTAKKALKQYATALAD